MATLVSRNATCYFLGDSMEVFASTHLYITEMKEMEEVEELELVVGEEGRVGAVLKGPICLVVVVSQVCQVVCLVVVVSLVCQVVHW